LKIGPLSTTVGWPAQVAMHRLSQNLLYSIPWQQCFSDNCYPSQHHKGSHPSTAFSKRS